MLDEIEIQNIITKYDPLPDIDCDVVFDIGIYDDHMVYYGDAYIVIGCPSMNRKYLHIVSKLDKENFVCRGCNAYIKNDMKWDE